MIFIRKAFVILLMASICCIQAGAQSLNVGQLDAGFHLFCNPGVIFATAADFNSNANYVAWDVKTGINFQYDRLIVSLAYELTNLTLYSGLSFEKYTRNNGNYLTHAGMLSIGYKF
ncbi:MAG: hypothetical protein J5995_05465 [Muribaculaceae bacterium]|nr:hypothetical protein [Muribaculaceae bacterium]